MKKEMIKEYQPNQPNSQSYQMIINSNPDCCDRKSHLIFSDISHNSVDLLVIKDREEIMKDEENTQMKSCSASLDLVRSLPLPNELGDYTCSSDLLEFAPIDMRFFSQGQNKYSSKNQQQGGLDMLNESLEFAESVAIDMSEQDDDFTQSIQEEEQLACVPLKKHSSLPPKKNTITKTKREAKSFNSAKHLSKKTIENHQKNQFQSKSQKKMRVNSFKMTNSSFQHLLERRYIRIGKQFTKYLKLTSIDEQLVLHLQNNLGGLQNLKNFQEMFSSGENQLTNNRILIVFQDFLRDQKGLSLQYIQKDIQEYFEYSESLNTSILNSE